ncbi:MAG: ATP-binding protein [Propionibacteriaceae bacterium]|nr:ATP-binding protein [Propionibacteriaceae bacterium]
MTGITGKNSPWLLPRRVYTDRLAPFVGQHIIKVVTGLRRSGKSSLLKLVAADLLAGGVAPGQIIQVDFESLDTAVLAEATALHRYLTGRMAGPGPYYVFLDEIQEVEHWEKAVNSLYSMRADVDIYLTGSNSRLLSSELATYIAGRYVVFPVSTLSFAEHCAFSEALSPGPVDTATLFQTYLRRGGFPGLYATTYDDAQIDQAVRDIYNSALIQDTIARRRIRNVDMLRRVAAFAMENVGNPFSARAVADFFKSQRRRVDPETILNYLDALCESYLLTRVPRYDLQGKKLLTINEKYYVGDHALIHAQLGYSDRHLPGVLENIVEAELRRRGYQTTVGKVGDQEVDFVATRGDECLYVQVTTSLLADERVRTRELAPLAAIRDSYPKLILSLDREAGGTDRGIRHLWLPQWLLTKDTVVTNCRVSFPGSGA